MGNDIENSTEDEQKAVAVNVDPTDVADGGIESGFSDLDFPELGAQSVDSSDSDVPGDGSSDSVRSGDGPSDLVFSEDDVSDLDSPAPGSPEVASDSASGAGRVLAQLRLELDWEELNYKKASLLQGVLFEHVDAEYAAQMHQQRVHPYSQYASVENGRHYWVVNTTSDDAYRRIILPLMDPAFTEFEIRHREAVKVRILSRTLTTRSVTELTREFYSVPVERTLKVSFLTPTAFKQSGRFVILPDLRLIYQSLMQRYTASSERISMVDEETLNELCAHSFISGHRLHSVLFPMSGKSVPGFVGNVTIRFSGPETLTRYVRMLLEYGEFSGVGVKTGMGMGAIRIGQGERNDQRNV